jgi:hypothetical protein
VEDGDAIGDAHDGEAVELTMPMRCPSEARSRANVSASESGSSDEVGSSKTKTSEAR